ncbi:acetate uptake transporter family protein [Phanerochaete sordida]|uniref:Acetate uptake transporter family protein n=1 Tax=Phanerochaete sordida TaxID=48140 RepID=A0A9P3G6L3_9APHY|nr:acetate uptake transporter family protein [Phanerochaete sordida]
MSHIEKAEASDVPSLTEAHRVHRVPARRLGNPGPLGLFSFASTTFILSFYNAGVRGVVVPNVVVGMGLGVGGLAQLLAGMWEFAAGNTFGATAFSSYGGFWLSFASLYLPGFGIVDAYNGNESELNSALGIYLITWFLFTFLMLVGSLRRNIGLMALFFTLMTTFMLLAISKFQANENVGKAGGAVGILCALIAYYVGLAELLVREESWFTLPLGTISKRVD